MENVFLSVYNILDSLHDGDVDKLYFTLYYVLFFLHCQSRGRRRMNMSTTNAEQFPDSPPVEGEELSDSNRFSLLVWFKARQGSIALYCLGVTIFLLLLWPSAVITIGPGHAGVLFRRFLGGTVTNKVFPEGTHFIFPWDTLFVFDTRVHEEMHTFSTLTNNGLRLDMDVSILYRPDKDRIAELLVTLGANYREKVIIPALRSSVLLTAAKHEKSDFFSPRVSAIEDSIHISIVEAVGRRPLIIDNFFLRAVRLPEVVDKAINEKFVAQQEVQRQIFKVEEAAQRYKISLIDAEAVRMTQEIVNTNMTEAFLRWKGIEATRLLASSPNSKFVIAGGKDGLPIILNPESSPIRESAVEPKKEPDAKQAGAEKAVTATPKVSDASPPGKDQLPPPEDFMKRINLKKLDETLDALLGVLFPSGKASAPQETVPNETLRFAPSSRIENEKK